MKKDKTTILIAAAAMALLFNESGMAQTNLGAACGCPPVGSRTTVNLSTLAVSGGATDGELIAANTVLTCDKTYILDKKIYVPNGKNLTIAPGTVIKGNTAGAPVDATALVVERGGKIFASGTATCPIVFTASADPMDGTYGVSNRGQWGGVVILGKAKNNLTLANATAAFGGTCTGSGCLATGVGTGFIEGFTAADARNQFGAAPGAEDDNDNSGIMRHVSIRHAGAVVATANELNGLTLGSVGRGTTLEYIEVVSNDDDGIEFFGGTVNLKYATAMYVSDDMFDWDLGYTGKMQFLFGIYADSVSTPNCDNGFECDGDDKKTGALPLSNPTVYNATVIGNNMKNQNLSDKSAHAGINGKELTQGSIYNSIICNFETGFNMQQAPGTRASGTEVYNNWNAGTFKVNCNTFVGNSEGLKLDKSKTSDGIAPSGVDNTKFTTTDVNSVVASVPGFDFAWVMNTSTNSVSDKYDATPNPNLSTTCTPPVDGFFNPANYKGAFKAGEKSWLSDWAYGNLVNTSPGLVPCPTDINLDGITNNTDFLQLLGQFGQSCN